MRRSPMSRTRSAGCGRRRLSSGRPRWSFERRSSPRSIEWRRVTIGVRSPPFYVVQRLVLVSQDGVGVVAIAVLGHPAAVDEAYLHGLAFDLVSGGPGQAVACLGESLPRLVQRDIRHQDGELILTEAGDVIGMQGLGQVLSDAGRTRSPSRRPCVSLIRLKSSRSTSARTNDRPACASRRCRRSVRSKAPRFGMPVSASVALGPR